MHERGDRSEQSDHGDECADDESEAGAEGGSAARVVRRIGRSVGVVSRGGVRAGVGGTRVGGTCVGCTCVGVTGVGVTGVRVTIGGAGTADGGLGHGCEGLYSEMGERCARVIQ
jgi:hypothetical protein